MPVIAVHDFSERELHAHPLREKLYNCFDTSVDFELQAHHSGVNDADRDAYNFELAMQAPALEMSMRGFKVDMWAHQLAARQIEDKLSRAKEILNVLTNAVCDSPINFNSQKALSELFYDRMKLAKISRFVEGEVTYPMDRKVLEQLDSHFWASPIVNAILLCRDLSGHLKVLKTEIDNDWRWRCSYNIGGTNTFRWSSSKSSVGTGNNFQNITEELRRIFIPDPGWKLYGIDLEQADAREVGWYCGTVLGDWSYLDACESGDLHTTVTRLCYPEWKWSNDPAENRALADRKFYRHFSYRDASKRMGHGCLTEDHEVLTPSGWVPISTKPPVIMAFNPKTNLSSFVIVENWTDMQWTGKFHEWNSNSISAKMTDSHRVYYTTTEADAITDKLVGDVPKSAKIPLGFGLSQLGLGPSSLEARLIAAYQCDGSHNGFNQIRFHMKKERKFQRLEELAKEAGYVYSRNGDKAAVTIPDSKTWPKKAGSYLLQWSVPALEAYLTELPYWDGSFGPTSTTLFSTDLQHLEWIQTCNRLLGYGGNIQKPQTSGFGSTTYRLQINNRYYVTLPSIEKQITEESARVLCPTLPGSAFYIRRGGKISITGNTNFFGKPPRIHEETKIPLPVVREFQPRYFTAFPCIPLMHRRIAEDLQRFGFLTNIWGQRRDFLGRRTDDDTLRKAIAFMFQSATGTRLNLGLWRIWRYMGTRIQILSQLHDAVYFQAREDDDESEIIHQALDLMRINLKHPTPHGQRTFAVPGEAVGGYNWAHRFRLLEDGTREEWNPKGLDKIKLH